MVSTDDCLPGDMVTGQTELFEPFKGRTGSPYSIFSDKVNNIWFLDFGGENIGNPNGVVARWRREY